MSNTELKEQNSDFTISDRLSTQLQYEIKIKELTEKILEYNKFKRVIIFSPTIEESYKYGDIQYNSKLSDKQKFEALKYIRFPNQIFHDHGILLF